MIGTIAAAILTGLIGNSLVQRWQQRNWYAQQRQIAQQSELQELKSLLEEITKGANTRLFTMKQLSRSLDAPLDKFNSLSNIYSREVRDWNIRLPSFYNRTTLLLSYGVTYSLEHLVQKGFFESGRLMERAIRNRRNGTEVPRELQSEIRTLLSRLNIEIRNLLLEMSRRIDERRRLLQYGRKVYYRNGDLAEYGTFKLFKMLFARDVDTVYIIRPA